MYVLYIHKIKQISLPPNQCITFHIHNKSNSPFPDTCLGFFHGHTLKLMIMYISKRFSMFGNFSFPPSKNSEKDICP